MRTNRMPRVIATMMTLSMALSPVLAEAKKSGGSFGSFGSGSSSSSRSYSSPAPSKAPSQSNSSSSSSYKAPSQSPNYGSSNSSPSYKSPPSQSYNYGSSSSSGSAPSYKSPPSQSYKYDNPTPKPTYTPPASPSRAQESNSGGFGSFGSNSNTVKPRETVRSTMVAPSANVGSSGNSALMRDLGEQRAKSNASAAMKAAAIGAAVGVGASTLSNRDPAPSVNPSTTADSSAASSKTYPRSASPESPSTTASTNSQSNNSSSGNGGFLPGIILGSVLSGNSRSQESAPTPTYESGNNSYRYNDVNSSPSIDSALSSASTFLWILGFILLGVLAVCFYGLDRSKRSTGSVNKKATKEKYTL